MNKIEARNIIMIETQAAIKMFNACVDTDKTDFDAKLNFINDYLINMVPENVRKLAV